MKIIDFEAVAQKYISRDGLRDLLNNLQKSDFYTAPASTRYHGNYKGGLSDHSYNVFWCLMNRYAKDKESKRTKIGQYSEESIAIVSLFHDLCKTHFYVEDTRNVKKDGKWTQVPYYSVNDQFPLGHGEKSLFMVNDCMELTPDEMLAIRWHMGGFVGKEDYMTLSNAYERSPLAVYLHLADMEATYTMDKKEE